MRAYMSFRDVATYALRGGRTLGVTHRFVTACCELLHPVLANHPPSGVEPFLPHELESTMRHTPILVAITTAFALAACGETTPPAPKVGDAPGTSVAAQAMTTPATADRDAPPAATPSTHDATPQPEAPAAPTARDTAAQKPMDDLSKSKETSSLPLPGQVNNHSTPALDQANKTTPQDGSADAKK
jgi:hypothetical protein